METQPETKLLYLDDAYQKEFQARIIDVIEVFGTDATENPGQSSVGHMNEKQAYVVLDQTLFYPRGGGQPSDTGVIICNDERFVVLEVIKSEGRILHKIDLGDADKKELQKGQDVSGIIDWERRYTLMRMHTSSHLIDSVLYRDGKILVTGNALGVDKTRIDFNMPEFNMDRVQAYINEANKIIAKDLEVRNYYLPREEAFKIPGIVKLAGALPPDISILRITEIVGLDIQADGGTHVKSLGEIGKINILSIENKGKERKRICYNLTR